MGTIGNWILTLTPNSFQLPIDTFKAVG